VEIEARLNEILRLTEETGTPDYAAVSANIYAILTSLLSRKNTVDSQLRSAPAIQQAVAYIAEHYRQNISTQDIADAAYLSRSYMSELFTQTYGMAPHEYLTMYRLTRVKDYLLNTSASLAEIAEQTGFRDIFTLSRVFKQKFGLSPSVYRKSF
jgi:AraC-like DNA-binding protein